jgi:arylsulfatase A-like enzyme
VRRRRSTRRTAWVAIFLSLWLVIPAINTRSTQTVAQAPGPPNILLIVTDDQRADSPRVMPTLLNEIAGRGIRFRKAFVPNALCCPARVSILTGQHSHTTGVWGNSLQTGYRKFDESSTVATWLDAAGYRTGFFGKYLNHWKDLDPTHVPPGWDEWFAFHENCCSYYGFTASVNGTATTFDASVYSTTETARRAADFLLATPGQPTFVLWAPDAPHAPARPETSKEDLFPNLKPYRPPNYMEADVSDKPPWVRGTSTWTAGERAETDALRRRMLQTLSSVDDGIRILLDALATSGRLSNTLIVYTSDNGFLLGEHRFKGKRFPWEASHRVPFIVRYDPLTSSPTRSDSLVLTIDIAPTIAELASIDPPAVDGKSLLPILRQERPNVRSRFVIEHGDGGAAPHYCGVRSQNLLFVRYGTGQEEFYDYRVDPWELQNRAKNANRRKAVARLRRYARDHCVPEPPGFSW